MDIRTILHALNTFPKSFFVWGILDLHPQRPVEMDEKLKREFPYLRQFEFLNKNNFNQYCKRSLKRIVVKGYTYWEYRSFQKEMPTWQLSDDSIQPIAGFLLTRCIDIGVDCESFLASRKNSSEKHNLNRIQVLLDLYENGAQELSNLSNNSTVWDSNGKCRHVAKLAEAGLIKHTAFSSEENHIGYRWIPGKRSKDVSYDYPMGGKDKYRIAMKKIVKILSKSKRTIGPAELAGLAGYVSESYTKNAVRLLHRQGFVSRLSKGNHSICKLTKEGERVVEGIIQPLNLALNGDEKQMDMFRKTAPDKKCLLAAMKIYAKSLRKASTSSATGAS